MAPGDVVDGSPMNETISQGDIEKLGQQIEALLERGRKLREVKVSSQTINLPPLQRSFLCNDSSINCTPSGALGCSDDPISSIVALIDATDPIYSSDPKRATVLTPSPSVTPRRQSPRVVRSRTLPSAVCTPRSEPHDLQVQSVHPTSPQRPPESLTITLRKKDSKVSVEVWDKKTQTLIGLGLGDMSDSSIKCYDVWDDHLVASVTVTSKAPSSRPSPARSRPVTPSPAISLQSSPSIPTERLSQFTESPLDEFLTSRSVKESRRPVSVRQSTESFLSFLSGSPNEPEEPLIVSSDDEEEAPPPPPSEKLAPPVPPVPVAQILSPKKPQNIFDTYVERLNQSLSSYDESLILDKLNMDMQELDSLTVKLRGSEKPSISPKKIADKNEPLSSPRHRVSGRKYQGKKKVRVKSRPPFARKFPAQTQLPIPQVDIVDTLVMDNFSDLHSGIDRSFSVSILANEGVGNSRPSSAGSSRRSFFDNRPNMSIVREVAVVNIDSPVTLPLVPLKLTPSLESLRKESIEQARKNIQALKGSLLSELHSIEGSSTPRN